MTTIGQMAPQVLARVEEPDPANPIFWGLTTECYSALVEACSDLLILIGRPTNTVQLPVTLLPNTLFQPMPPGMFAVTNVQGPDGDVYKFSQFDMDYSQASWQSSYENDLGDSVLQWWPLGLTAFGIHPAVEVPEPVIVTGIQLVTQQTWPFDGTVVLPFHAEFEAAIEKYAAHYLRFKESGAEFQQSLALYQEYLDDAKRLTEIEDRKDDYIFSRNLGIQVGVAQTTKR
jgi:hypothetical protein